ncbi:MAG: CYTH domain-containing protein [Hydrogenophaga sp.]|nr:CYTH domain-containing protein [Hydrogenophaga sp.]
MPQETELKLAVHPQDLPRLLAHPLLTSSPPKQQRLRNTYYDTAALDLMQRRMAVRERQIGGRTLLTVKTAGQSVGGLSRRGEWEAPTEPGQFDFATLVDDAVLCAELSALASQLLPVFQTDFVRRSWLLQHGAAVVEVALDQGHISSTARPGAPAEAILELELELKEGEAEALFELAKALADGPPDSAGGLRLQPSDRSKAERGYDLFCGRSPGAVDAPSV